MADPVSGPGGAEWLRTLFVLLAARLGSVAPAPPVADASGPAAPAPPLARPTGVRRGRRRRRGASARGGVASLPGTADEPFVVDVGDTRQLHFSLGMIQSAMRLDDPAALTFAYTRKMMAALLFVPAPRDLLMVGLGGGSIAKFCLRHLPEARFTCVEINPAVIALREAFLIPDDPRLTIVEADAADYLPLATGDTDLLLLDGFDADGVAPSLLSPDFYAAARRRLRSDGVLVANLCGAQGRWTAHLKLLEAAFEGRVHRAWVPDDGNLIAYAFADTGFPIDWAALTPRAAALARTIPLDFPLLLQRLQDGAIPFDLPGAGGSS